MGLSGSELDRARFTLLQQQPHRSVNDDKANQSEREEATELPDRRWHRFPDCRCFPSYAAMLHPHHNEQQPTRDEVHSGADEQDQESRLHDSLNRGGPSA
jgi:hypothetical protein